MARESGDGTGAFRPDRRQCAIALCATVWSAMVGGGVAPSQSTVVHSRVIGQCRWARKRNAALEWAMLQRQTGEVGVSQSQKRSLVSGSSKGVGSGQVLLVSRVEGNCARLRSLESA